MLLKYFIFCCVSVLIVFSQSKPLYAEDISTVTEILETAEGAGSLVDTSLSVGGIDDVTSGSGDSGSMFSEATSYATGATVGLSELISSLASDAVTTLSATASSVGLSDPASGLLSGSGYSSGQSGPVNILDDIATSTAVGNLEMACVEYRYIGECWSIKTSYPWKFATKSIAQNYIPDLQVEVTSRTPSKDTDIFENSDNAPTDIFSGGIIQNVGTIFGRIMDGLFSLGPDLQWMENQSAKTDTSNTLLFREAMVIGNPTESLTMSLWSVLPGYCSSSVPPYTPFFLSSIDVFSWRILATTDALILAIYSVNYASWNEIGASMGSVYPRLGLSESPEEFDTGVTMAYRAVSIVSDLRTAYSGVIGLHIALPTPTYAAGSRSNMGDMKFRTIRDHSSQLLRMTYPKEANTCTNYSNISKVKKEVLNKMYTDDNKYQSSAFKVYRPYICCKRKYSYIASLKIFPPSFKTY